MSNSNYYKRIPGSPIQGDATTVTEPYGTLVLTNNNELRLHDGSTAGGNAIGGGGSNLMSSFGTDQGVGSTYLTTAPVLFTYDDMVIRTGGTAAAGGGGSGQMYIMSAETLQIGTATDPATLTDATSGVTCDTQIYLVPAHSGGPFIQTTVGSNQVSVDNNGVSITTVRGNVQFGYDLEAPGVPTHFHINKADQSFDLFFGDDANYFHLPAGGASPIIGANGGYGQKLWQFDQAGSLLLPQSGTGAAVISAGSTALQVIANSNGWTFGTDGSLTVPGAINSTAGTGAVVLNSNDGETTHTWTFGTDGGLTFPDATTQTTAYKVPAVAPLSAP